MKQKVELFDMLSSGDREQFSQLVNTKGVVVDKIHDVAATEGQGGGCSSLTMQRLVDYREADDPGVRARVPPAYTPPMI